MLNAKFPDNDVCIGKGIFQHWDGKGREGLLEEGVQNTISKEDPNFIGRC
jgi:hypothetical protein